MEKVVQMQQLDNSTLLLNINNSGWSRNKQALMEIIDNIISVPKKSIIFNREFGLGLEEYLFRPFGSITSSLISASIRNALTYYLPELEILSLTTEPDEQNRSYKMNLKITHSVLDNEQTVITKTYNSYA